MNVKRKISEGLKLLGKILIILTLVFSSADMRGFIVVAQENQRVGNSCDTIGRPGLKVYFKKVSGGSEAGQELTTLIGKKEELVVDLVMDAAFDKGAADNLNFKVDLPYFYYGPNNTILTTYNIADIPIEQLGNNLMGVQARVVNSSSFDAPEAADYLYKGSLSLESGARLTPGVSQTVRIALSFYGAVPENAGATIKVGGGYKEYVSDSGESCSVDYNALPGNSEKSNYTLINSNLVWNSNIEQVGNPVMWDRYNYMTYKVTVRNDSTDDESYFSAFDLNLDVPNFNNEVYGVLDSDILTWIYNENGEPIKNEDTTVRDADYVGIPNEGGVLVYDVTNKTEAELNEWDLDLFSNVEEEALRYRYTSTGVINVPIENQRVIMGDVRTYYIAIPFANNFPEAMNYTFSTRFIPTIYFNQGLSWSKDTNLVCKFIKPESNFAHEKYLLDKQGNKVDKLEVAIGDNINYYLSGFANTGNIPVFNPFSIDTLPNNFELNHITIELNNNPNNPAYIPKLSDWFDEGNAIDFEFKKSDGTLEYVKIGDWGTETTTANGKSWSLDLMDKISEYSSTSGNEFTGHMRINLAETIAKNRTFNGRIIVNGDVSMLQEYTNTLDTHYEVWIHNPSTTTSEASYSITKKQVEQDIATVKTIAGSPDLVADAFHYNEKTDTYTYGDPLSVAIRDNRTGYRYRLGNKSVSPIEPVIFNSGDLLVLSNGDYYGLEAENIVFSNNLMKVSQIESITMSDTDGNIIVLNQKDLKLNDAGELVIDKALWKSLKNLKNVEVKFSHFNKSIAINDEDTILINGTITMVGSVEITATFATQYNNQDADSKATDKAKITAVRGVPLLDVDAFQYDKTNQKYNFSNNLSIAAGTDNTGYRYKLGNDSISAMSPAIFKSGNMLTKVGNDYYGLIVNSVKISSELANLSDVKEIIVKDTNGKTVIIKGEDLINDNGVLSITSNQWNSLLNFYNVEIIFNSISDSLSLNENINIMITGASNYIGSFEVKGTLSSQYNGLAQDVIKEDNAFLNTLPSTPIINVDGVHFNRISGQYNYADSLLVAVNEPNSGYRYRLGNTSISVMDPGIFESGTLLQKTNNEYYGLVVDSIELSKGLMDNSKIKSITLTDTENKSISINSEDIIVNESGKIILVPSQWSSLKNLNKVKIEFKSFNNNISLNDDINIMILGTPTISGSLTVTGTLQTNYAMGNNKSSSDNGTLRVDAVNPILEARSFDSAKKYSGVNTPTSAISGVTVPNKEAGVGYEFTLSNDSTSNVGKLNVDIDLSSNVGKKNTCTTTFMDTLFNRLDNTCQDVVKGFDISNIYLSANYKDVGMLDHIEFYDWDQTLAVDTPKLILNKEDISILDDGRLYIGEDKLTNLTLVKNIRIVFSQYYGKNSDGLTEKLVINIDGNSDWFDNLDAKLTFNPVDPIMKDRVKSVTARLTVKRPALMIHTNISYFNLAETKPTNSANTDGNETRLGIPYDRDFKYRVSIENQEISKLDDVDIIIDLPVNANAGVEANTGFHTTQIKINKDFISQFEKFESITLFDIDNLNTGTEYLYDQNTNTFNYNGEVLAFNSEGILDLTNISKNLGKIIITGDLVKLKDATTDNAWLDIYGYSDSNFGTNNTITATSNNYLDGIREDKYKITAKDTSISTVSKMYFDTILNAGYKDADTNITGERFDNTSTAIEDMRSGYRNAGYSSYYYSDTYEFKDNSELDIGYKAIGSYMLDFRQYLNVKTNYPTEYNPKNATGAYYSQEHYAMDYIYTQSLNTAANVNMTVQLPSDMFETYYLKVHPKAIEYLNFITVYRTDGSSYKISKEEWQNEINNAVEISNNGETFFRINLLNGKDSMFSNDINDYYSAPSNYSPQNLVTKVELNIDINKMASNDGMTANNPDFGTWYNANQQNTKYMFEITGRFYKTGKAEASAYSELVVGGDRSKQRTDSGLKNDRSSWSYSNTYKYQTSYNSYPTYTSTATFDAQHLKTTARAYVRDDNNSVLKGVHKSPSTDNDINVAYAKKDTFAVSFYRSSAVADHDYKGGSGSVWYSQDIDDWRNRLAYTDQVILEDILPKIRKDGDSGYYGFLTEDIAISPELYTYLDYIEVTKQKVIKDPNSTAMPDSNDGMKGYKTTVEGSPFVTLTKDQLVETDADGRHIISFKYKEQSATATSNNSNEFVLEANEYIYGYKIYLKNIPGNGDYARELEGASLTKPDAHGTSNDTDVLVGGYVYLVNGINPVADATNTINSHLLHDGDSKIITTKKDTAYLMGYRLPFKAGYALSGLNTGTQYDYESITNDSQQIKANITPHTTSFGMKIWNQPDGNDEKTKASRIKETEVTNTLNANYNLKKINIPKEFIDGQWFNVESIKLNYSFDDRTSLFDKSGKTTSKNINDYLKTDSDGNYYFDVNQFILEKKNVLSSYSVDNSSEKYLKEHIDSFVIILKAVNPDTENTSTLLAASEYLSPTHDSTSYSYTYDGVWVNRSESDLASDAWTENSRPTFGMVPNSYSAVSASTSVTTIFTAADFNAQNYQDDLANTTRNVSYNIANLVGTMNIAMERGKTIEVDGKDVNTFAYDKHVNENNTNDYDTVDKNHIAPFDYIDYVLTIDAKGSAIDLNHSDMRFTAPNGQRIVGWEIVNNTTTINNDDIKAYVQDTVQMKNGAYYVKDIDGNDTNYKEINISLGDEATGRIGIDKEIKVVVYTQMNDELKDSTGKAAFEGKTVTATFEAASKPTHTYSQYKIVGNNNSSASNGNSAYATVGDVNYYRKNTDFYRLNGKPYKGSVYTSIITSDIKFKDSNNLWLEYVYTDLSSKYDGQPMQVKVSGKDSSTSKQVNVLNDLNHNNKEVIFEVSFMSTINNKEYKGFDLTKKPELKYPANMTSSTPIKVEYLFEVNGKDEWIDGNDVKTKLFSRLFRGVTSYDITDAKKIRWTYYDVPAFGNDGNEIVFATTTAPFILEGVGRYNDVRPNENQAIAERYEMKLTGSVTPVHEHNIIEENTIEDIVTPISIKSEVTYEGVGQASEKIARERPILTYQTQIFNDESEASGKYNADAVQKNSYRPNDKMWYKVSVVNNKLTDTSSGTGLQGVLLNPVFYDKVPEYVTPDMSNIKVRWLDGNGNVKQNTPTIQIDSYQLNNIPDYGGDMVFPKGKVNDTLTSNISGRAFDDVKPSKDNSTPISYTVYQFSFGNTARLEVGESIEIWYEATARTTNLPMVYTKDNENIYPEYYPKMGEYGQNTSQSWPLAANSTTSGLGYNGTIRKVDNSSILMDMNYLIHDIGISGDINPNVDRYEFLKDSTTYIPGSASNTTSPNIYGNNGIIMDMDNASGSIYQKVTYVPSVVGGDLTAMPSVQYTGASNTNRDLYQYVVKPRTDLNETAWDKKTNDTRVPILWSEARTHLQTAWVAASTEIIPDKNVGETQIEYLNHAREYLENRYSKKSGWGKSNPNYSVTNYSSDNNNHGLYMDDSIATIEYDENYTAQLSAYNYGDWNVDGVEFIYVLPRGVEPRKDASGNLVVTGASLSSGDSRSPVFTNIDGSNIKVEVLQDPTNPQGYLSPKKVQDPFLVQDSVNTTTDDYSKSQNYYDKTDATSWVLKITVNKELSKWFNRGSESGYILQVNVGCHVSDTNESEYWYDKVYVRPIETENSLYSQIFDITAWQGSVKEKVFDPTNGTLSTQYGGMDYLWCGYSDNTIRYVSGSPNTPYINGYNIQNNEVDLTGNINGTVVTGDLKSTYALGNTGFYASTGTRAHMRKPLLRTWTTLGNDLNGTQIKDYYLNPEADESKLNIHVENNYYWNDLSTNNTPTTSGYYYSDGFMRRLHNYSTDGGNRGTLYYPVISNILPAGIVPKDLNGKLFTTDNTENDSMKLNWTLFDGVTNISLKDSEQDLYIAKVEYIQIDKEDGTGKENRYKVTFYQNENKSKASIRSGDQRIFSFDFVTVSLLDRNIKSDPKNNELLATYSSNRTYVTSQLNGFKFITDSDISGNPYTVGAKWNPYYLGKYNTGDTRKDAIINTVTNINYPYSPLTGGYLPKEVVTIFGEDHSVIDATKDGGNKRYKETDDFDLEDYPTERTSRYLNNLQKDFDLSGSLTHQDVVSEGDIVDQGIMTSMRIRVKHPRIENKLYVSDDITELGSRDDEKKEGLTHYPNAEFDDNNHVVVDSDHKQYGDYLWYTSEIKNAPKDDQDYAHEGDVLHSKIMVTMKLPMVTHYREDFSIEFLDVNNNTIVVTKEDIESGDISKSLGWKVQLVRQEIDATTNEQTIVFEIITPNEANDYQEYLGGKHLAGYLGTNTTFNFKVKTVIDNLEKVEDGTNKNYWDNLYAASAYVTLEDSGGSYLNMPELSVVPLGLVEYVRAVNDHRASIDIEADSNIDYDLDGDFSDIYASDTSARFSVLKPNAQTRLDTSVLRNQISNPDAGIVIAEDPSIKGSTEMTVYLDQVVNKGGAVPEFVVDYRVPFRGTPAGTLNEAPMNAKKMLSTIQQIRTGVWELPSIDNYHGAADLDELKSKLKVNIYALINDKPANEPYVVPGLEGEYTGGNWIDLGSYGLEENQIIDLTKSDYASKIYQIRYVIRVDGDEKDTEMYPVPQGFRLNIDANETTADKKEEMDDIDPNRNNVNSLPNSVVNNAAYIKLTSAHQDATSNKLHVNNLATSWARYDNSHYSAISKTARAGYFVSAELPYLQVDLKSYYFNRYQKEDKKYEYEWTDKNMVIKQDFSTMLKYKAEIKNLNDEQITSAGFVGQSEDNASKPEISTVLPYLEDIMDTQYQYVDASSEEFKKAFVSDAYRSEKRLERNQSQWTYYVVDADGNRVDSSTITDVKFDMYSKNTDLTDIKRKVLTWSFDGLLKPGQSIVVEFMVPLSTKDYGMTSSDLLKCSIYGFKQGSFKPYIPTSQTTNETYGFEIDKRDINNNGATTSEATLVKGMGGISFESKQAVNRLKTSYSEYDTNGLDTIRPSLVPEGTDYEFRSVALNPDTYQASGYKETILYDVLPYANDSNIVNEQNKDDPSLGAAKRSSTWRGWLIPESVQLLRMETPSSGGTITSQLIDNQDCEIWVGPFEKKNGQIIVKDIGDLPEFSETKDTEFYNTMYTDEAKRSQYFVKLKDLLAVNQSDPNAYQMLAKNIQAIWAQVASVDDLGLDGGIKYELRYKLHAPINTPQYPGAISSGMADDVIRQAVADYTGWNTFATQTKTKSSSASVSVVESPRAGVYLNAPAEKGYIGSYVWQDADYNTLIDEGEYERRADGRLIFKNATKDLDYDGVADDPGINGVKVELLSENGYPVNKLGEAVVLEPSSGKYIKIDETTGLKLKDVNGTYEYAIYGPASYTTEADAYGNNGYFIISNITPGNYKLRYTFPDKVYNNFALTTTKIGDSQAKMEVYRDGDTLPDLGEVGTGDVESDAMLVSNKLIVQTTDSIKIDAIGLDASTYPAYGQKMTSYNVGVSRSYVYGGYAWLDQTIVAGTVDEIESNGIMDKNETRIENVDISFYEVTADGLVLAKDADGNDAITKTDQDGYFAMSLYPNRSYVATASTAHTNGIYKPSPITINTDPKTRDDDNDLTLSSDKKTNQTFTLYAEVEFDNNGKPIMDKDGNYYGVYKHIGLGFVEAGRGYVGKYIWEDKNYDGIRNDYTNGNGQLVTEPGISDIKLILEGYYYKPDTNEWIRIPGDKNQLSNTGGSYTFQNVKTTHTIGNDIYLAGYKIKVDMSTVSNNYAITKYQMNNGTNDNDLPIDTTQGYLTPSNIDDLKDGFLIIADNADENTSPDYVLEIDGVKYNVAEGKMLLDLDIGLTSIDHSEIKGKVWDDKNYDGIQNKYYLDETTLIDEPGLLGVEVQLKQYYYQNDQWIENPSYVTPSVKTDANGEYHFSQLESYIVINGVKYLASYKIEVKDLPKDYAVTKYKATNDEKLDSNLIDDNLQLNDKDDYIIVAKKVPDINYDESYIIKNKLGNFDINKIENINGYDAGLTKYETANLSGNIWDDKNYDGLMNQYIDINNNLIDEPGINNVSLLLHQYYLDKQNTWQEVPNSQWDITTHQVKSNADGKYQFENVDTYVFINNQRYLAGYRIEIEDTSIAIEDYAITLYQVETKNDQRNSNLNKDYYLQTTDEYLIAAKPLDNQAVVNTPYIIKYNNVQYDLITALDSQQNDGGFSAYQLSTLSGNVFEDSDYDGIHDSEETYEKIKDALEANKTLDISLKGYYLDENNQWQEWIKNGNEFIVKTSVDENGEYQFVDIPTTIFVGDKHYLAGYKLYIEGIPNGYGITKHLSNNGVSDNTLLKEADKLYLTKTTAQGNYMGNQYEELDGYIIAAYHNTKTDIVNENTTIQGFDSLKSRTLTNYNVGYVKKGDGKIIGTLFDDHNYNGFYDKEENGINDIDVFIEQYYLDKNEWKLFKEDYGQTTTKDVSSQKGIFEFNDLPTTITLNGNQEHLASYKIKIGDIPDEYGITYLNMRSDQTNGLDETRDSDLIASTHYLTLNDGKKTSEENIIIARQLKEGDQRNELYIYEYDGHEYDVLDSQTINDFDGGLVEYQPGSIEGFVWLDSSDAIDTSYDGIKNENELGINNQEVILSQYLLDKDGHWQEIDANYALTKTNEKGAYSFKDLEVFKEEADGTRLLYGYQIRLDLIPEGYAVTKYRQGEDATLDSDLIAETTSLTKAKEYVILANEVTNNEHINYPYTIKVDNGWFRSNQYYDILVGENNKDYSAGFSEYQLGSIEGFAFVDDDYDGVYNQADSLKEGMMIQLKRYYYDQHSKKWTIDNGESKTVDEYYKETFTDENGRYQFDQLETYKVLDNQRYLYGYQVWINDLPQGYAVTKYQQNQGINDSSLVDGTLQVIKAGENFPEIYDDYIVVAKNVKNETYQNTTYLLGDYDIVDAQAIKQYNVGITKIETGNISGQVWADEDYNGIYHDSEKGLKDIEVTLETYYYNSGKWTLLADLNHVVSTSEQGSYSFTNLPTHGYINDKEVLYGYKVKIESLPKGYNVTDYHMNNFYLDSDLNETSGYLTEKEDILVLAQKADATAGIYNIDGYNIIKSRFVENLDAGLSPYQTGTIESIVFVDENQNGIFDEDEKPLANQTVKLEVQKVSYVDVKDSIHNSISEDGEYELMDGYSASSDSDGKVVFENVPMINEQTGELYRYRLRMDKPSDANFTNVQTNQLNSEDHKNSYGQLVSMNQRSNEHVGITHSFELLLNDVNKDSNYYGLRYKPTQLLTKGTLYMGISYTDSNKTVGNVDTGDRMPINLVVGMILLSGFAIVVFKGKKKEHF